MIGNYPGSKYPYILLGVGILHVFAKANTVGFLRHVYILLDSNILYK